MQQASQPGSLTRLARVLVHADTSFFESCIVFAMSIRAHFLLTTQESVREVYPIFTHYVPPQAWLATLAVSAVLITYGLASPIPPTIVRRRFRAVGLLVAALHYATFSLALALGEPGTGEGALTWALSSFSLLASARLFGLVAGEREAQRLYDPSPSAEDAQVRCSPAHPAH